MLPSDVRSSRRPVTRSTRIGAVAAADDEVGLARHADDEPGARGGEAADGERPRAGVPGLDLNPVARALGQDLNLRHRLLILAALLDLDEHFGPIPGSDFDAAVERVQVQIDEGFGGEPLLFARDVALLIDVDRAGRCDKAPSRRGSSGGTEPVHA